MTDLSDAPTPAEAAEAIAEGPDDVRDAVYRDRMREAVIDANNARHMVRNMHVNIDAVCDDHGLLPDEVARELRDVQDGLLLLDDWLSVFADELEHRYHDHSRWGDDE